MLQQLYQYLANFKSNETICSRRPLDVRYDIAIFQYAGKVRCYWYGDASAGAC